MAIIFVEYAELGVWLRCGRTVLGAQYDRSSKGRLCASRGFVRLDQVADSAWLLQEMTEHLARVDTESQKPHVADGEAQRNSHRFGGRDIESQ